jgi:hypothetical protein
MSLLQICKVAKGLFSVAFYGVTTKIVIVNRCSSAAYTGLVSESSTVHPMSHVKLRKNKNSIKN